MTHPSFERLRLDIRRTLEAAADFAEQAPLQRYEATSADAAVRAVVSGTRELLELSFSPLAKREVDNHTLGDDVVAAVRAAERLADEARTLALGTLTIDGRPVGDLTADPQGLLPRFDSRPSR
jgi:DNA-binding protein YbaB